MVTKDGQRFEGCWLEGRKDGPGFVVGQDGDWFEGIWRFGKKEGPGLNPFISILALVQSPPRWLGLSRKSTKLFTWHRTFMWKPWPLWAKSSENFFTVWRAPANIPSPSVIVSFSTWKGEQQKGGAVAEWSLERENKRKTKKIPGSPPAPAWAPLKKGEQQIWIDDWFQQRQIKTNH